jgi:hypothetical protein
MFSIFLNMFGFYKFLEVYFYFSKIFSNFMNVSMTVLPLLLSDIGKAQSGRSCLPRGMSGAGITPIKYFVSVKRMAHEISRMPNKITKND